MARSERFTALSGPGIIGMGIVGGIAAVLAARASTAGVWIDTWLVAAVLASAVGIAGLVRKARQEAQSAFAPPTRRFLLGFLPPVVAGAILTIVLFTGGHAGLLPGIWLLLYGAGVVTGGQASVPLVPATGGGFMVLGVAAFFLPAAAGDVCLGIGFGVLHVAAGLLIWRRHGG